MTTLLKHNSENLSEAQTVKIMETLQRFDTDVADIKKMSFQDFRNMFKKEVDDGTYDTLRKIKKGDYIIDSEIYTCKNTVKSSVSLNLENIQITENSQIEKIKASIVSSYGIERTRKLFNRLWNFRSNELHGKKFGLDSSLPKIVKESGWRNPDNESEKTLAWFRKWICWLFGKDYEDEFQKRNISGKENILAYIMEYYDLSTEELFEKLWNFNRYNLMRNVFGLNYNILKLVKDSGWKVYKENNVQNPAGFKKWICWLFDKDYDTELAKRGC